MPKITIVVEDIPGTRLSVGSVHVTTDTGAPCIGQPRTPAESLAMDLLRQCKAQATHIKYGTPCATLAGQLLADLLHPEALGHAVTAEVRDRARQCLGMPAVSHLAQRTS